MDGFRQVWERSRVLDLSFGDQILDSAGNGLDRDIGIDAMLIVDIDVVGLEAPLRLRHDMEIDIPGG